jgi:hypothetical protein
VIGTGFPGFVAVSALTVGDVSALPVPNPSTDVDGNFTVDFLVPQLGTGTKALLVTVGSGTSAVTASADFTVDAASTTPVVTTTDTAVVFADEITSDNLVRVWLFDNATQGWTFYDPDFGDASTYAASTGGDIVWVNVASETTFQGATLFAGWNLISLD